MSAAAPLERCPIGLKDVPCSLPAGHRGICRFKCCEPDCPGLAYPATVLPHFDCGPRREHHKLATWLFKRFRPGGGTLTKDQAYRIGDELNRLHLRIRDLEARP